jgi:SAM-dependent methyltransferase
MSKTATDQFWNQRAVELPDEARVNIADTVQRDFELEFITRQLSPGSRMLEVGCGNGYVTAQIRERVGFVDAFDYAENMVERARSRHGETNNRFFHDNLLRPSLTKGPYDAALCVRVLINLRNTEEQIQAVRNIAGLLRPGGRLILIEGYRDGFDTLNELREKSGLAPANPAPINFYSYLSELMPTILELFAIEATFNTGLFDLLTRVVYPSLVGADKATEPGEFHEKIAPIVSHVNSPELARYARVHGFALAKK